MFSSRMSKLLSTLCTISRWFGSSTLEFVPESRLLKLNTDSTGRRKLTLNYILCILWYIGALGLVIKFRLEKNIDRFNVTLFYFLIATTVVLALSAIYWFENESLAICNGTIIYVRYFQEKYIPTFNPEKDKLNLFLDVAIFLIILGFTLFTWFLTLYCVYDPQAATFQAAWIPDRYYSYFPVGLSTVPIHMYLMMCLACSLALLTVFGMMYLVYFTVLFTKELRYGLVKYRTEKYLRCPENLRLEYRAFQILHIHFLSIVGRFLLPFHYTFMFGPIFGNVALMLNWNQLQLVSRAPILLGSLLMTLLWQVVLQIGKYLFVRGNRVLGSWKRVEWGSRKECQIMVRFRKSCQLILLACGKTMVIGRMTQFQYTIGITRGTARALIALRGKRK